MAPLPKAMMAKVAKSLRKAKRESIHSEGAW
jgi:hypothetical protein